MVVTVFLGGSTLANSLIQQVVVNSPAPEHTAEPGQVVEVRLVIQFSQRQELSSPVVEYEVIDRRDQVLVKGTARFNAAFGLGGNASIQVPVPEDYNQGWIGLRILGIKDSEHLYLPVDRIVGLAVKGAVPYEEGTLGWALGVSTHFGQGLPHQFLPLLKELGVHWVRDVEYWPNVEQRPGEHILPSRLDARLRFYEENNLAIHYYLAYGNSKAYPDDPYNPQAYARFAEFIAKTLSEEYDVDFALMVWNEPHNFGLGPDLGGNWNAVPPSPWVDHYLVMVTEAVRAVHAYDPDIIIIDNEDVIPSHYWFLAGGLPADLTGFGIHPYGGTPEQMHYGSDASWAQPWEIIDAQRSRRSLILRLQEHGERILGHRPQIWITEWGRKLGEETSEEQAAIDLPRFYITTFAAGVKGIMWFNFVDWNDGPYGLLDNDGYRRLTFQAYKTLSLELGHFRLVDHLIGHDHLVSGRQAYLFEGPTGYKLVLWNIDGPETVVVHPQGDGPITVVDHLGRTIPVAGDELILEIGPGVLYIGGVGPGVRVERPFSLQGPSPANLSGQSTLDLHWHLTEVEEVVVSVDGLQLFSYPQVVDQITIDTTKLPDGPHTLTVEVRVKDGRILKETWQFTSANFQTITDRFRPPLVSPDFGFVDYSITSEESAGWCYATGTPDLFFGDRERLQREADTEEYLIWPTKLLQTYCFVIYAPSTELGDQVRVFISREGQQWEAAPMRVEVLEENSRGWYKLKLSGTVADREAHFLKLVVTRGPLAPEELQLGEAEFVAGK